MDEDLEAKLPLGSKDQFLENSISVVIRYKDRLYASGEPLKGTPEENDRIIDGLANRTKSTVRHKIHKLPLA